MSRPKQGLEKTGVPRLSWTRSVSEAVKKGLSGFFVLVNNVRTYKIPSFTQTASSLSQMAGSVLLFAMVISAYNLTRLQSVSIAPGAFSWMSDFQVSLDPGAVPYGPFLSEFEFVEKSLDVNKTFKAATARLMAAARDGTAHRVDVSQRLIKAPAPVRFVRHESGSHRQPSTSRSVGVSKALVVKAPVPELKKIEVAEKAKDTELLAMQGMHSILQSQLRLAMTIQPQQAEYMIATQEAAAQIEGDAAIIQPQDLVLKEALRRSHRQQTIEQRAKKVANHPVSGRAQKKQLRARRDISIASAQPQSSDSPQLPPSTVAIAQDKIQLVQAAPSKTLLERGPLTDEYSIHLTSKVTTDRVEQNESEARAQGGAARPPVPSQGNETVTQASHAGLPQSTLLTSAGNNAPLQSSFVNSHRESDPVNPRQPTGDKGEYSTAENSAAALTQSLTTQVSIPLTEGFDWKSPVIGGKAWVLSQNEAGKNGWFYAHAADHLPTLARGSSLPLPLISLNAVKLLSSLTGTALQSETGIVFGKVPAGWTVRLSGRSERAIFLNEQKQSVSPQQLDSERSFALLNVAPGSHLIHLVNRIGAEEGAVGIIVQRGVATYVDFRAVSRIKVTGRVLEEDPTRTHPNSNVMVRILGSSWSRAETDANGRFTIDNVLVLDDFPVYFEVDPTKGFTHRYQLSPTQAKNAVLYTLNEDVVQDWLGQLEGTISPQSGLVVAAAPALIASQGSRAKPHPWVRSLSASLTLDPETYTVSTDGQLQVDTPMDVNSSRFVTMQVPEGPAVTRLSDGGKKVYWQDLIIVSPGVINMIGPL